MKENTINLQVSSLSMEVEVVSERGSLGLLAIGAVGLYAWRKKREEAKAIKKTNEK